MINILAVMAGGALGSALRYWMGVLMPVSVGGFPGVTLLVNVLGSFALGIIVALGISARSESHSLALFLGTGLCGGFTTYSAFAVESVGMLERGEFLTVTLYVIATLVCCALAAAVAVWLVRRF